MTAPLSSFCFLSRTSTILFNSFDEGIWSINDAKSLNIFFCLNSKKNSLKLFVFQGISCLDMLLDFVSNTLMQCDAFSLALLKHKSMTQIINMNYKSMLNMANNGEKYSTVKDLKYVKLQWKLFTCTLITSKLWWETAELNFRQRRRRRLNWKLQIFLNRSAFRKTSQYIKISENILWFRLHRLMLSSLDFMSCSMDDTAKGGLTEF